MVHTSVDASIYTDTNTQTLKNIYVETSHDGMVQFLNHLLILMSVKLISCVKY